MSEHNHATNDARIFVFGSNLLGIHGAGAARYAHKELGFAWGAGEGVSKRAYALPTCSVPGIPLSLDEIKSAVDRFIHFASEMLKVSPDERFFVSEVGCGFAGFTVEQIAPLFEMAPANCDLSPAFDAVIADLIEPVWDHE